VRIDPRSIDTLVLDLDGTIARQVTIELVLRSIPKNAFNSSFWFWLFRCGLSYLLHGKRNQGALWAEHLKNGYNIWVPEKQAFFNRRALRYVRRKLFDYKNATKILVTRTIPEIAEPFAEYFELDEVFTVRNKTNPEFIEGLGKYVKGNVLVVGDSQDDYELALKLTSLVPEAEIYFAENLDRSSCLLSSYQSIQPALTHSR